jgi:hypothetical protein
VSEPPAKGAGWFQLLLMPLFVVQLLAAMVGFTEWHGEPMLGVASALLMLWLKIPLGLMWGTWVFLHDVQGWSGWAAAPAALSGALLAFADRDLADGAKRIGGRRGGG